VIPFLALTVEEGVTLNNLKDELARADARLKQSGRQHAHEMTPSQFILQALEIEEQQ